MMQMQIHADLLITMTLKFDSAI